MKSNRATYNRPGEDRVIDAPYVITDINGRISQLKEEEAWKNNDRNGITLFKTAGYTVVLTCFHKQTVLKHHDMDAIATIQVVAGSIRFRSETETVSIQAPGMVNLHPGIQHEIEMVTDTALVFISNQ